MINELKQILLFQFIHKMGNNEELWPGTQQFSLSFPLYGNNFQLTDAHKFTKVNN